MIRGVTGEIIPVTIIDPLGRFSVVSTRYLLRAFFARRFDRTPRSLLTTLLPVPVSPSRACSIAVWI